MHWLADAQKWKGWAYRLHVPLWEIDQPVYPILWMLMVLYPFNSYSNHIVVYYNHIGMIQLVECNIRRYVNHF